MERQRRSFTEEYKRQAVDLVYQVVGRSRWSPRNSVCGILYCAAGGKEEQGNQAPPSRDAQACDSSTATER